MPLELHLLTGTRAGDVLTPSSGEMRLGRGPGVDVVIAAPDDLYVSRHHATLRVEDARIVLIDEGSTNGTYVNGRRVQRLRLGDGDEVRFGGGGPKARVVARSASAGTAAGGDAVAAASGGAASAAGSAGRGAGPPPPVEGLTAHVRRAVESALAETRGGPGGRSRWALPGVMVLSVTAVAFSVLTALGFVGEGATERRLGAWEERYRGSVVLVEVGVQVGDRRMRTGWGTGFVADSSGLIVTNKHVIHAHKYSSSAACLAEAFRRRGIDVEESLSVTVWRGGTRFRADAADAYGDPSLGLSTEAGTLEVVTWADDAYAAPRRQVCTDPFDGRDFTFEWRRHLQDNHDLALLRASADWDAMPLAAADPEAGDDILVLGFPRALTPLETEFAVPIGRRGEVLRTQETVQIDAVVLSGNSGGPLINADGEVVGITTRGIDNLLNMAIRAEHARALVERVRGATPSAP